MGLRARRSRALAMAVSALLAASVMSLGCSTQAREPGSQQTGSEGATMTASATDSDSGADASEPYETRTLDYAQRYAGEFETHRVDGRDVFVHVPNGASNDGAGNAARKVPLVLFMCGTGGDPRGDAAWSGWVEESDARGFILATPDYENYATYSQVPFLNDVLDWAERELPVDVARVYSVGFSNGGATSVALASESPERIAAISAAGWMVDLRTVAGPAMPFQVIQGTGEFTERSGDGAMRVMDDERAAIRSFMVRDGLIGAKRKADYAATPYWGYAPDAASSEQAGGFTWDYSNYRKDGYESPFAQLVLVGDDVHRPRADEARIAWEFLRHFRREGENVAES